jgi:hypothetical protein
VDLGPIAQLLLLSPFLYIYGRTASVLGGRRSNWRTLRHRLHSAKEHRSSVGHAPAPCRPRGDDRRRDHSREAPNRRWGRGRWCFRRARRRSDRAEHDGVVVDGLLCSSPAA